MDEANAPTKKGKHITTPRLYKLAAGILNRLHNRESSLRTLVFDANHPRKSSLLSILSQIKANEDRLEFILTKTKLDQQAKFDRNLLKVIVHEITYKRTEFNSDRISSCLRWVLGFQDQLIEAADEYDRSSNRVTNDDYVLKPLPKYARVNTLKTDLDTVLATLVDFGFEQVENEGSNEQLMYLGPLQFTLDNFVPDLLVFSPQQNRLFELGLCQEKHLLLQSKSSCLSSYALKPAPGSVVLDACAAPGMKTTHLAALMQNTGVIYAFDSSAKRVTTLREITETAGVTCSKVYNEDFTKVDCNARPYCDVEYILLDPSCSGSGMSKRFGEKDVTPARLRQLAGFQKTLLKYALSFPKVKVVVYSTCSTHTEENEEVVDFALSDPEIAERFRLARVFKQWKNRGDPNYAFGEKCLRASVESDLTDGFFVAKFKLRKKKANGLLIV